MTDLEKKIIEEIFKYIENNLEKLNIKSISMISMSSFKTQIYIKNKYDNYFVYNCQDFIKIYLKIIRKDKIEKLI